MTTLHVRIETMEKFGAAFVRTAKDIDAGRPVTPYHGISFDSYDDMYALLSPSRLAVIRVLAGQGALSIREVARRLGRDVQAVHRDVTRLIKAGVVDRSETGVSFPHDEIDFSFKVTAAA